MKKIRDGVRQGKVFRAYPDTVTIGIELVDRFSHYLLIGLLPEVACALTFWRITRDWTV